MRIRRSSGNSRLTLGVVAGEMQVENVNNGLYQPGKFKAFVFYKDLEKNLPASEGFVFYRDAALQAHGRVDVS